MPCGLQRLRIAVPAASSAASCSTFASLQLGAQVPLHAPSLRFVERLFCEFVRLAHGRESLVDIADQQVYLGEPRQKAAQADVGLGSAHLLDTQRYLGNGRSGVRPEADRPAMDHLRQPTNEIEAALLAACDGA